jgi:hypothetical protein
MRLFCRVGCASAFFAIVAPLFSPAELAPSAYAQVDVRKTSPSQVITGQTCEQVDFRRDPGTGLCYTYGGSVAASIGLNAWPGGAPRIGGPGNTSDQTLAAGGISGNVFLDMRSNGFRLYTDVGAAAIFGTNVGINQSQPSTVPGDTTNIAASFYYSRAFIQFAGFTAGKAQSIFDPVIPIPSYNNNINQNGGGSLQISYAWELGNGMSLHIGGEDAANRRNAVWDATTPGNNRLQVGTGPGPNSWGPYFNGSCGPLWSTVASPDVPCGTGSYAAQQVPDLVSSLRVDQAWGSAQIGAALHQIRAGVLPGAVAPSDAWGWAAMGGIVLNLPWNPGDKFWVEGAYGVGAPAYTGFAANGQTAFFNRFNGDNLSAGWALDGVFASNPAFQTSGIQLSQSWTVSAALEHYWTPQFRTSLYGNFAVWIPGSAGNDIMCRNPDTAVRTVAGAAPTGAAALPGCNFGFNMWTVGTRTIWNPVRNLDVGVEVMYSKIDQNMDPNRIRFAWQGGGNRPAGLYVPADEGAWSGMFRVQRNFWP